MELEEADELTECVDCSAEIHPAADRTYPIAEEAVLCFECAVRRGGVYDATEERWTRPPRISVEAGDPGGEPRSVSARG